ncbi:MAG TPA: FAD-dependent oxidoreductase [Paracoccaceae bacterium]|nr:FAD-dependent oxidoreductase [Paracoccaceae bacterium]
MRYQYLEFPYVRPAGLTRPEPCKPVVIIGAGPVGLALAIDLALRGVGTVLLDDNNVVSVGSRAICWSKRTLEIFDRLGVGERMLAKGVTWKVGRTRHREREVFSFDLLPEAGHKMPAFINLQQYYVEQYLVERCRDFPDLIDLRWKNRVVAIEPRADHVVATVETPDGNYRIETDWLVACDGARSPARAMLGLDFAGELFEERFLIADIEMEADFPSERWFWFEPPFHNGQSALLHKQPDNIWRIDLQLGWDADPEVEKRPENILPRIRRVVAERPFTLDWSSIYTFQCRRLERFVHGRVIFAGDSAHVVSPFGARGGNGGIQDADNLGWKLAAVIGGESPVQLLETYDAERVFAADENIRHSARATRFMSPDPGVERLFRDQVLALAARVPFARGWVNSGRLSTPATYPSAGHDDARLPAVTRPGAPAQDAPIEGGWLLGRLGADYTLLGLACEAPPVPGTTPLSLPATPEIAARYLGQARHALYLIRPDQHVAARWVEADPAGIAAALAARGLQP